MDYKYSNYNILLKVDELGHFVLYNVLRESLLELNESDKLFYEMALYDDSKMTDCRFEMLRNYGFIIDYDFDEIKYMEYVHRTVCYSGFKTSFTIAPTMDCNMRCSYCFENHKKGKMSEEIQNLVCQYIINVCKSQNSKMLHISWFGGEPIIAWNIIVNMSKTLIDYCEKHDILYFASIITNGTLLNKQVVADMYEFKIERVQITIDGDKKSHDSKKKFLDGKGTYDIIKRNVMLFKDANIKVDIRVNIDANNLNAYDYVKKMFSNCDWVYVYPSRVETFESCDRNIQQYTLERKKFAELVVRDHIKECYSQYIKPIKFYSCQAECECSAGVDSNGYLYKCWNELGLEERAFGNVKVPNDLSYKNIYKYSLKSVDDYEECMDCKCLPLCYGGCSYLRHSGEIPCIPEKYIINDLVIAKYKKQLEREGEQCEGN